MSKASVPSKAIRCAIYTRKSTDEGLDQAFNSLDAQREACSAYVASQRHEGWVLDTGSYDDGGFSGGNMDRPGLKRLLEQVRAKRVDVIVVYKVDRLTRNLGDFARIVDVLDAADASFVSITQAFNTTTSMGRLTLNVLLSFAQFEREVTGERIRDKIAASKAKGMWMGGVVPLGYDVLDRKLVVNETEAKTVRLVFTRYLALGSVIALQADLETNGIFSKERLSRSGRASGGHAFSRGALYLLLQNRIYIGDITHKGVAYAGEHAAIVERALFDAVQAQLESNRVTRVSQANADQPSLLTGKLWDQHGRGMSPGHARKQTKRYRYYVSRTKHDDPNPVCRVPAGDLEELVIGRLRGFLMDEGAVHDLIIEMTEDGVTIQAVLFAAKTLAQQAACDPQPELRRKLMNLAERLEVHPNRIDIHVSKKALISLCRGAPGAEADFPGTHILAVEARIGRAGRAVKLVVPPSQAVSPGRRDAALIKLVVKAHAARAAVEQSRGLSIDEIAKGQGYDRQYFGVLLRLSYLAPEITSAILDGTQPPTLTRQKVARASGLPHDWAAQRAMLLR